MVSTDIDDNVYTILNCQHSKVWNLIVPECDEVTQNLSYLYTSCKFVQKANWRKHLFCSVYITEAMSSKHRLFLPFLIVMNISYV